MIKRLLVPLDGSVVAEQAIPLAGRLARVTGGTVVLLRAVSPPADSDYEAFHLRFASAELDPAVQLALKEAKHYLEGIAASRDLAGVETSVAVKLGAAAAIIVAVAEAREIDLIVMGSHDGTDMHRCVLDSVARMVMRHTSVPVLILRQQAIPIGPFPSSERPFRVLVALDGSKLAEAALVPAAYLAAALAAPGQGAIHLVRVVAPDSVPGEALDMTAKGSVLYEAQAYLASLAEHMRKGMAAEFRLAVTWSVMMGSDIAHAIITATEGGEDSREASAHAGCGLIALAIHGRVGLERLATDNVAEHVLVETCLPVLVVRPEHTAGEQSTNREEARQALLPA